MSFPPGARSDVVAGATIWALLVPSALAYSAIAGVEPLAGLVGVPCALIGYALLGGSKVLVVGADAAVSVLVGSTVASMSPDSGAVVVLSALVAVTFFLLHLLRLGWAADMVPEPVLKGFVQGLAIVTIVGQIPSLLGLSISDGHDGFFGQIADVVGAIDTTQGVTAAVGIASLVALLGARHFRPKWPIALIVLVASGVAIAVLDLVQSGVSVVGEPTGSALGAAFTLPDDLGIVWELWPPALAIVVLGFTESLGASQMVADYDGEPVEPSRELLGLGAANAAVAVGGAFAVTGALSKTAVAISSGARTRLATMTTAALAVATIIFLRPLFDYLGSPVLAAVVVWAMAGMIDLDYFSALWRSSRVEFVVAFVAFSGVLLLGVLPAVLVATVLALGFLARHVARPRTEVMGQLADGRWRDTERHPAAATPDGIVVVRIEGPLVFVNARDSALQLRSVAADDAVEVILLDGSAVTAIDTTAVKAISSIAKQMGDRGQELWVARLASHVEETYLRIAGDTPLATFESRHDAIEHFCQRAELGEPNT